MNKIIYKRQVFYHDADDKPQSSILKITTRNSYIEYTQCNPDFQSDFKPKTDGQKQLHDLWDKWHIKKYCELNDEDKKQELINLCNSICDLIEEEEKDYLKSLEEKTEEEIDDDRILALGKHLELSYTEMYEDIFKAKYGNYNYEYGNQEYLVMTNDEADVYERETVENTIQECYIDVYSREMKNNPMINYIDLDRWVDDWCGDRGNNISSYDGYEYYEEVNGETYYIYRIN